MNDEKIARASEEPQKAPFGQGTDTSEAVSGGPEDLMVQDLGGTLPLASSEVPHYYGKHSSTTADATPTRATPKSAATTSKDAGRSLPDRDDANPAGPEPD